MQYSMLYISKYSFSCIKYIYVYIDKTIFLSSVKRHPSHMSVFSHCHNIPSQFRTIKTIKCYLYKSDPKEGHYFGCQRLFTDEHLGLPMNVATYPVQKIIS